MSYTVNFARGPRSVVTLNGELITTAFGRNGWKYFIVPELTKLVGA